jgi:hypothetical protein
MPHESKRRIESTGTAAIVALALGSGAAALVGCTSDDGVNPHPIDTGVTTTTSTTGDGGSVGDGSLGDASPLAPFTPPTSTPPNGAVLVTASGEVLSLGGYAFPPVSAGDTAFVDGWQMHFDRLLVTLDHLTLSETPDLSPTDPSRTGPVVATLNGPFAIDLHKGGPLAGKGGSDEQSVPIGILSSKSDGSAFDPTVRYAFGFDVVAATNAAQNVNLDAAGRADYAQMVSNGWSVMYVGTATFRGGSACTSPTTGYDFGKLPSTVSFRFGFPSPTRYDNCQNPDNDPAAPFGGEEHERGVQVHANIYVIAQATIHTDHPFWESVIHDSPAHFDPIAARLVGSARTTVTLDDLVGVDFTSFHDGAGAALPWRTCLPGSYTAKPGTMAFDPQSIPVNPSASAASALRDYRDFVLYNQSTQGHLNSDGLCFVRRQYPSPP